MRAAGLALLVVVLFLPEAAAQDSRPINPFGTRRPQPSDAPPGVVRLSNGKVYCGDVYLTPGKRWRFYDEKLSRYVELPLRVVRRVQVEVVREWLEKEWRFREAANNEKVYTGRKYPARILRFKVTLINGRQLVGRGSTVLYVRTGGTRRAKKFILKERQKGKPGQSLKQLVYVQEIDFRPEVVEQYRQPAAREGHDVQPRKQR